MTDPRPPRERTGSRPEWEHPGGAGLPVAHDYQRSKRRDAQIWLFTCCGCGKRLVDPPGPPAGDCSCGGTYVCHRFDPDTYRAIRRDGHPRGDDFATDGGQADPDATRVDTLGELDLSVHHTIGHDPLVSTEEYEIHAGTADVIEVPRARRDRENCHGRRHHRGPRAVWRRNPGDRRVTLPTDREKAERAKERANEQSTKPHDVVGHLCPACNEPVTYGEPDPNEYIPDETAAGVGVDRFAFEFSPERIQRSTHENPWDAVHVVPETVELAAAPDDEPTEELRVHAYKHDYSDAGYEAWQAELDEIEKHERRAEANQGLDDFATDGGVTRDDLAACWCCDGLHDSPGTLCPDCDDAGCNRFDEGCESDHQPALADGGKMSKKTDVEGDDREFEVSTVRLGAFYGDHNYETCVFWDGGSRVVERYTSEADAEDGHEMIVAAIDAGEHEFSDPADGIATFEVTGGV